MIKIHLKLAVVWVKIMTIKLERRLYRIQRSPEYSTSALEQLSRIRIRIKNTYLFTLIITTYTKIKKRIQPSHSSKTCNHSYDSIISSLFTNGYQSSLSNEFAMCRFQLTPLVCSSGILQSLQRSGRAGGVSVTAGGYPVEL